MHENLCRMVRGPPGVLIWEAGLVWAQVLHRSFTIYYHDLLNGVTGGNRGLRGVTRGNRGSQRVTERLFSN